MLYPLKLLPVYCLQIPMALIIAALWLKVWQPRELSRARALTVVWLLAVAEALFYSLLYSAENNNFIIGNVDMATLSQVIWKMAHLKSPVETILNIHTFRCHFSPLFYIIALLLHLWPSIDWLIILVNLSVAVSAVVIYMLARDVLKSEWLGLAFAVSFLLNPFVHMGQMAGVHAEVFDISLICLSLHMLSRRKYGWFWLWMVAACLGKEDVGFYYSALGVYVFFGLKDRRNGLAMTIAGLVWSIVVYTRIMPSFGPDSVNVIERYSTLGGHSFSAIARNLVSHPWHLFTPLLQGEKIVSLFYLVGQTLFAACWSGWALVPLAASVWLKSVTDYPMMYLFWDHYALHILPFLYFASVLGLRKWQTMAGMWNLKKTIADPSVSMNLFLALWLIVFSLQINFIKGHNPLGRKFRLSTFHITAHSRTGLALLKGIPSQASVLAQENLAPHVCFRDRLYAVTKAHYWIDGKVPAYRPDYAVFDLETAAMYPFQDKIRGTVETFRNHPDYTLVFEKDHWLLFRKKPTK